MQKRWHMTRISRPLLWLLACGFVLYGSGVLQVEAQLGSNLIGKLEGPEIVTDAAQIPKSFKEAPAMTMLVQQGKLPPVQERVSQEPMVLKPVHEIGKHGGT